MNHSSVDRCLDLIIQMLSEHRLNRYVMEQPQRHLRPECMFIFVGSFWYSRINISRNWSLYSLLDSTKFIEIFLFWIFKHENSLRKITNNSLCSYKEIERKGWKLFGAPFEIQERKRNLTTHPLHRRDRPFNLCTSEELFENIERREWHKAGDNV